MIEILFFWKLWYLTNNKEDGVGTTTSSKCIFIPDYK